MRLATKLGLVEFFEREAADLARRGLHEGAWCHNLRSAAKGLRLLTEGQEGELLEWQVGGPDGIGPDSYDNPIKIIPFPGLDEFLAEEPPKRRHWLKRWFGVSGDS